MATLHVDVVSAEEAIFADEAKFVVLPGESGELGILPGHTPLISRIRPGTVKIVRADEGEENIFVAGAFWKCSPAA
ncbi:ATP synthase F1, epsilon subunit [Bordetella holmesii 44057]|nr:ATP synthase F1, epsilon subunit [Bordetella holmesii 44057]